MKQGIRRFFKYARARHEIHLRRVAGEPRPWTKDPILGKYRFTNVFRELDKTTVWFRKHVRDPLRDKPEVLLATVLFRMLNRIETGEAVFSQTFMTDEGDLNTAFEKYLIDGNRAHLKYAIIAHVGKKGPYVTGGYIISSPPGYSKLDGMLRVIDAFNKQSREWKGLGAGILDTMNWNGEEGAAAYMLANRGEVTLESTWNWLRQFDYLGRFHSYEIVTDLRHTSLLENTPDVMLWANPGPGARRGMNRVHGRDKDDRTASRGRLIEELRELTCIANSDYSCWPREWPRWEMRESEHSSCEFDKFERVRLGEGRPRGVYR